MRNFEFLSPTRIIFGKDTEKQVGEQTKNFSKHILLHYGGGSIKKSGLYDTVVQSLKAAGVSFTALGGVKPNPRVSLVRKGIEICREQNIDFILAVGGGSVIDSAKAIAAGVPYEGDVWDFFRPVAEPKEALPIGVVLTIPASGSEASKSCVITNEEGWYKRSMNFNILRPQFSILNPALAYTLPAYQTACGAADIMAHVMERYFTNEKHVDFTDRLCEATLKTIIYNGPTALKEPENYDAWAEIMWAGAIAHNDFLGTGRVPDGASHKIEHELSGIYDVAHGAGLTVVFPAWMRYVYKHNMARFEQFAVRVWEVDSYFDNPEKTILEGIQRMENFFLSLGLPVTMKGLDITDDRIEEMAAKATERGPVGNLVKLYKQDVYEILQSCRK